MGTLLFLAFVVLAIGTFVIVTFPLVFLANKAIASAWEREAEQMKQSLARTTLGFSEDAVPLRELGAAPFAIGVRWIRADLRIDGHALYLMRYQVLFGRLRIGQPNLRLTWLREPGVGGFKGLPILGRPTVESDCVLVQTEMGLTALTLRLRPRDPRALLSAIEAMR